MAQAIARTTDEREVSVPINVFLDESPHSRLFRNLHEHFDAFVEGTLYKVTESKLLDPHDMGEVDVGESDILYRIGGVYFSVEGEIQATLDLTGRVRHFFQDERGI
jgi:hypothetical protein